MSPSDCIEAAARYLATEPAAVRRALREHRRGTDGRCVTCGDRGGVWPCAVHAWPDAPDRSSCRATRRRGEPGPHA